MPPLGQMKSHRHLAPERPVARFVSGIASSTATGVAVEAPTVRAPRSGALYRSRRGRHQARGRRPSGRALAVTALVVTFVLLLSTVAWVGARAVPARTSLLAAGQLLRQLQDRLVAHDLIGARATLNALQDRTEAARSATMDVDWRWGARLPGIGVDLAAVRTVAYVLDDLSHSALPAMVDLVGGVNLASFVPRGGRFDLTALQRAAPAVIAVDTATRRAVEQIAAIPSADLLPPLRDGVAELADGLAQLATLTATAAKASVLLPSMLGAGGPRTYLVLLQNLAEARATGGLPGAFLVVRADRGEVSVQSQGSAGGYLSSFDRPVLPLDPDMAALYTDRMGTYPGDINASPHFPTAAALAREMYRLRSGTTVDGVIAADPVALAYLLRATGPVPVDSGAALSADNAVRMLLSQAYTWTGSAQDKDQYAAAVVRVVFEALTRGLADPRVALSALARAAGERRLLVWSADPVEQTEIAGTVLEGSLPVRDGLRPTVGLFLNDASGAKLDYYLTHDARLEIAGCRTDGRRELTLHATLGSTAPPAGLPDNVVGLGLSGDPYTVRTNVMVFSPAGGAVTEVRLDGMATAVGGGEERRRQVAVVTVDLAPGQTRTLDVRLLTEPLPLGVAPPVTPALWVTPGVNPWQLDVASTRNCSLLR